MSVLHVCIAIGAVLLLIMWLKFEPVIALLVGCLYLGIATGLGAVGTLDAIVVGFGDLMGKVGLLIGFGVLMGALLHALGVLQRFVSLLIRIMGPRRLPYAMSAAMATLFPSIYPDVQLVLAAPLVRTAAPALGRNGLPLIAGATAGGILIGLVLVVPGLSSLAIAGVLDVPLATMLLLGLLVGPPTAVLTTAVYSFLLRRGLWNRDKDEEQLDPMLGESLGGGEDPVADPGLPTSGAGGTTTAVRARQRTVPLGVAMLALVVPLILVAFNAVAEAIEADSPASRFAGNPTFALFLGMVGAYVMARLSLGSERTDEVVSHGLAATGQILLITGIGGSFGAVIDKTDLGTVLGGLFSASGGSVAVVLLLAWFIAALLHFAIGSITVAAITAAGILLPIMGDLGVHPGVLGLAVASGALFALQVNSNFFWMFQSLLGITTQGALKSLTLVTALASIISLPMVLALGYIV